MAFLSTQGVVTYDSALRRASGQGWIVVSEGPSGAQLKKAKEMKTLDKWLVGIGVPLVFVFGTGLILVAAGLLDYALFTRERTFYLSRATPGLPVDL